MFSQCSWGVPETIPSYEGVSVVSGPALGWELFQKLYVATTEHNIIGFQCRRQLFRTSNTFFFHFFLPNRTMPRKPT